MMSTAAVIIGVDSTGHLPPLSGAASGAKSFAKWAESQGYQIKLFTDGEGNAVTLKSIRDEIRTITESLVYEKLIIFFSGHGFLLSPQSELWLLSASPDPETEAVNVRLSAEFARYCGIPHIIFVSDACRSGGPTHRHRSVTGASIFPNQATNAEAAEIDFFYATRPGDTALEINDENKAINNYKGIFTECLLHALQGDVPEVVKEVQQNSDNKIWLIPSHPLRDHLKDAVPKKAQEVNIRLNQHPEVRAESHLPNYFGKLNHPPTTEPQVPFSSRSPKFGDFVERIQDDFMSFNEVQIDFGATADTESERLFTNQMEQILNSRGRQHFETTTGFTVYDHIISAVVGGDIHCDHFYEDEVTHIRVDEPGDREGYSILIELESGLGTVLAVLPGFIGTVVIEEGKIATVNYTPSDNTYLYEQEYKYYEDRIERRRAFAAAAVRHGVFNFKPDEADYAAGYLRMMKRLDPTLGIYASYAYSQAGQIKNVRSVLNYMSEYPPVPFDVLLLSSYFNSDERPIIPTAPFCPMLRQGWTLLDLHPEASEALNSYKKLLEPSLWTTFTPEGVERVRNALLNGDLL
ncbi:MAG: caspase family protein [Fulvivirga sp.]|nr:caspase family protein [Fulvivirga sp.]